MADSFSSRALQRRILISSALLVFFSGLLVALITIAPMAERNKELRRASLDVLLENRQIIVKEFLLRATDVGRSINSRTRARQLLDTLNRGDDAPARAALKEILADAHRSIEQIGGITWIDNQRQIAATTGLPLPSSEWLFPTASAPVIGGPLRIEGRVYVLIAMPIFSITKTRIGTSLLLFDAADLEIVTRSYAGLGQTGEVILGSVENGTTFHFFPLRSGHQQFFSQQFPEGSPLHTALQSATRGKSGGGTALLWDGVPHLYRYVPVNDSAWGLVAVMAESDLFQHLQKLLMGIGSILVLLLPITMGIMVLVLRPLTGRLLLRADELKDEVAAKTAALKNELQQRERTEAELRATTAELSRSNGDLSRFAYVTSHDLQEPLRMVASYLTLIERRLEGKLDASSKEFFTFAVDGAKRMQAMITALLAYARISSNEISPVPFRSEEALDDALLNLQVAVEESAAKITRGTLPVLRGDRIQVMQLFQNLVENGIKYRRKDEPPEVNITAMPATDGYCQFTVRDNGIGIDPKFFTRLFTIFQRLHTREQYEGTGIGLALCRRIVERHGGRIWVESEPDKGTAFHFTLPRGSEENGKP